MVEPNLIGGTIGTTDQERLFGTIREIECDLDAFWTEFIGAVSELALVHFARERD